jgi:hypothetical protein
MSPSSWRTVLLLIVCLSCAEFYTVTAITTATAKSISTSPSLSMSLLIQKLRGGESTTATNVSTPINSSKKKKKRSKTKRNSDNKAKKVIDDAMKEKDAAEALGDAIR